MSLYEKYKVTKTVLSNICFNKLIGSIDFKKKKINYYKSVKFIPFFVYAPYIYFNKKTFIYFKYKVYSLNKENICISPIINKIKIGLSDNQYIDFKNIIDKYSYSFPLWVILELENLRNIKYFQFERKKILKIENIKINVEEHLDKTLYEIFNIKN